MLDGLITVARWDLMQRLRSRRLLVGWLIWVAVLVLLAGVVVYVGTAGTSQSTDRVKLVGPMVFGLTALLMLAFSLVVVPIFSASAIVAERESATLATLQATTLRPSQIVGGKLVSACVVAAGFMAGGIPAMVIAVVAGPMTVGRAAICLLVMYAEMVFLCAIALGWSAVAGRALISTVMTYLTVFTLTIVTLIAFTFLSLATTTTQTFRYWRAPDAQLQVYAQQLDSYFTQHPNNDGTLAPAPPLDQCAWGTQTINDQTHTERYWWLLLANPFVIVADAAPLPSWADGDIETYSQDSGFDPLVMISYAVRSARLGEATVTDDCFTSSISIFNQDSDKQVFDITPNKDGSFTVSVWNDGFGDSRPTGPVVRPESPVPPHKVTVDTPLWPIGLAVHLVLAVLFFVIAVRRVSVPYGHLPKGQRVA